MNNKVFAFDLGGVLFSDGTKQFIEYLQNQYGVSSEQASELLNSNLGSQYREGKISREQFWNAFKQELSLTVPTDVLEKKWIDGYVIDEKVREIIIELSSKHKVYYLSDNVKERVDVIDAKYHFLGLFEGGVLSYKVGVRKPSPEIYQHLLKETGADPKTIVFIDDKDTSLVPARELGMECILFTNAETLKTDLIKKGYLHK